MTLGDGWEHGITLEKILLVQEGVHYPICLRGNVRVHLKTVVGFVRSAMRPEARAVAYFDTSVLVKRYVNHPGGREPGHYCETINSLICDCAGGGCFRVVPASGSRGSFAGQL